VKTNKHVLEIAKGTTVQEYKNLVSQKKKNEIAKIVEQRLLERYVLPIKSIARKEKNGFCMMAIACLLIETLEQFLKGVDETPSKKARTYFADYFERTFSKFPEISIQSGNFYSYVRCGLLHSGETKGGWRIRREGKLFNTTTKTINANYFFRHVENSIFEYRKILESTDWNEEIWKNLLKKINHIICNSN
jgi:hypothetical protein